MAFAILAFYSVLAQLFAGAAARPAMVPPLSGLPQQGIFCFGNGAPGTGNKLPAPAETCQCLAHCTGIGAHALPVPAAAFQPVRIAMPVSAPLPAAHLRDELTRPAHIRARGPPVLPSANANRLRA